MPEELITVTSRSCGLALATLLLGGVGVAEAATPGTGVHSRLETTASGGAFFAPPPGWRHTRVTTSVIAFGGGKIEETWNDPKGPSHVLAITTTAKSFVDGHPTDAPHAKLPDVDVSAVLADESDRTTLVKSFSKSTTRGTGTTGAAIFRNATSEYLDLTQQSGPYLLTLRYVRPLASPIDAALLKDILAFCIPSPAALVGRYSHGHWEKVTRARG